MFAFIRTSCLLLIVANTLESFCSCIYMDKPGYCEPFSTEFLAGVVSKGARELLLPDPRPPIKDVRFDLYTRKNPLTRQTLHSGNTRELLTSNFDPRLPVRFSIHGWNGQTTTCSNAAIKDAYMAKGAYNVFLVDWSDYAIDINYIRVITEVFEIAAKINAFTTFIHQMHGIRFEDMYLIGHSFGCHIAGVAGKLLRPHRYGVIYALDTAGPIHRKLNDTWRITSKDAIYVESIQTDLTLLGFATDTVGHATFAPNWGLGQSHCPNRTAMEIDMTCDHFSALYYFVESLLVPNAFGAIRCGSYSSILQLKCGCGSGRRNCPAQAFMGGDPATPKRGIYYLSTRPTKPYGFGNVCRLQQPKKPTVFRLT